MKKLIILTALLLSSNAYAQVTEADMLRGQTSGVRVSSINGGPDDCLRVDIRGLNTLRSNTSPLWIVDGAILSNASAEIIQPFFQYSDAAYLSPSVGVYGIDVNDIESVQVLKNTSATALYGSKGANGVVIVTTKRPQEARLGIDLNTKVGVSASDVMAEGIVPAIRHEHSISLGSKGNTSHFNVSAFFRDIKGVYEGTGRQNYGVRASIGTGKSDVVTFGANFSLYLHQTKSPSATAWYGAPSLTLASRNIVSFPYNDPSRISTVQGWLADYDNHRNSLRTTDNAFLNVKLAKGFFWKNSLSADFQSNTRYVWYGKGTAFGEKQNGAASVLTSGILKLDLSSALEYSRYIKTDHYISASAAFEYMTDINRFHSMAGADFVSHELRAKALSFMASSAVVRHFNCDLSNIGGNLNLHYDYKSLVGADVNLRYDTYMTYDRDNSFLDDFFPSAQAYVDLHGFLIPSSQTVSTLRLEGGYGVSGTRSLIPYNGLDIFTGAVNKTVDDELQAYYKGFNRVSLSEYHATVNAGFLSDRILVSATYYDRKINDGLSIYCFGKLKENTASAWVSAPMVLDSYRESSIINRGVELDVTGIVVKGSASELQIGLNAAYNFNRLTSVAAEDANGLYLNQYDMYATVNRVGYPVSSIYGYTLDSDNVVTGSGILGNTVPVFTGSVDVRYRIGSLSLDILADWAVGHKILNMNRMLASGQEYVSAAFVEKGDYLRLSRVSASYEFAFKAKWIRALSVSIAADNLLTATAYSGWNPDVNSFGHTNMSYGLDYGSCPMIRSVVLGLAVKF